MSDEKMVNSFVYENDDIFHINRLGIYLADICNELDIETPVILKKHMEHFYLFNMTTFSNADFISPPKFDKMIIENIS